MVKVVLTGDRPTGRLHLGHYCGSLKQRLILQKNNQYRQFVMIADVQALTDNFAQPQKVAADSYEVAMDYLALGLKPELTTIFIQSQILELYELTIYFLNLVNLGRLERNPTVKAEIGQKRFEDGVPVGFFCYPISQAADILAFKADCVPVGHDQLPMIEQANEIARRFNRLYNSNCFKNAQPLLSSASRLVGLDGKAKMSKSLNNAIYLCDEPETIKSKVFSMYTDANHLKVSDPGQVEGNTVFTYLDVFHDNKEELTLLKAHYQRGGLGDTTIKKILNDDLQNLIAPIRDERRKLTKHQIQEILELGTENARQVVQATLAEVRSVMSLNYFT